MSTTCRGALDVFGTRALALTLTVLGISSADAQSGSKIVRERPTVDRLVLAPMLAPASDVKAGASPGSIRVGWACPAGATGYEVFATPAGGQQVKLTAAPLSGQCVQDITVSLRDDPRFPTTNNTPSYRSYYLHTGLGGEEQWTYVVRALYPNGVADAAPVMATTPSWPAPTSVQTAIQWLPPTGSNSRGTQVVVVTWIGAAGVPGYLVYRVPLYGEPDVLATPTPVTGGSWTDQSPIYTKGYKVKSVGGLISAQADIAW